MESSGIGYHFTPTDVEMLILLRQKAEGKQTCSAIIERDMYGEKATPWMIFREDDPWETIVDVDSTKSTKETKALYVITKLMKISELKTVRVAGCGTWDGQTGKSYIKFKDKKIGFKKMFNFRAKNTSSTYGNWIMHEYHLDGDFLKGVHNDYVICRIKRVNSRNSSEKSCTVYSGIEVKASEVQEDKEFSRFPGCSNIVRELGKRKYPSTFEEETSRASKLFKLQIVDVNSKDSTSSRVDAITDSTCDFAVKSLAGSATKYSPELINIGEGSFTENQDLLNELQKDGENEESEFREWTGQEIEGIVVSLDKDELSVYCEGVQIGSDIHEVSNPNPTSTSSVVTAQEHLELQSSVEYCQRLQIDSDIGVRNPNSTYTLAGVEQENVELQSSFECQGIGFGSAMVGVSNPNSTYSSALTEQENLQTSLEWQDNTQNSVGTNSATTSAVTKYENSVACQEIGFVPTIAEEEAFIGNEFCNVEMIDWTSWGTKDKYIDKQQLLVECGVVQIGSDIHGVSNPIPPLHHQL